MEPSYPSRPGALVTRNVLVALIAVTLASIFVEVRYLGIDNSDPSNRTRFHALPVAISQIYHGRSHDYTADRPIAMLFQQGGPLSEIIAQAIRMQVPKDAATYFWVADDRGLSDFVNVAFRLFGPTISALAYFWIFLLGMSLVTATVRFWRDPLALIVLACTTVGIGAVLPVWTRAASAEFAETSLNLSESRMFDVLGIVAAVHLILVMIRPKATGRLVDVVCLVLQACFIAALIHARSSVAWLFLAVIAVALAMLALRLWLGASKGPSLVAPAIVVTTVVAAFLAMLGYQRVMFNPTYFAASGPRTFWHNVLMGVGQDDVLAAATGVTEVSDKGAIDAVLLNMKRRDDPRLTEDWERQNILYSLGGHGTFDWQTYEQVARELVIRTILSHPVAFVRLFFWDRPADDARILLCRFGGLAATCTRTQTAWVGPEKLAAGAPFVWLWLGIIGLVATSALSAGDCPLMDHGAGQVMGGLIVATVVGLSPSLIVYPTVVQLGGDAVLIYSIGALSAILATRTLHKRLQQFSGHRAGHSIAAQSFDDREDIDET